MADTLKATLFMNGSVTHNLTDVSGSGASNGSMTAAESHDANNATLASVSAPDDGAGLNGSALLDVFAALTTAAVSGAISFIRVKFRGRRASASNTSGSMVPLINGTVRGSLQGLSTSYADYTQDFSTDPADGAAWTNAKLNAQTFGMQLAAASTDPAWLSTGQVDFPEFSVEVWGPSAVTDTPASTSLAAVVGAAIGVVGLVTAAALSVGCTAQVNAPTNLIGGLTSTPASAAAAAEVPSATVMGADGFEPSTLTPLVVFADDGSAPVVLRSNTNPYKDGSLATLTLASSPGSWPNSGTLTWNFGGVNATTVQGSGLISGVKLFAIVRPTRDANAVLNNFRFLVQTDTGALLAQPTVYTPLGPLNASQWQTVESGLITQVGGDALTWENLVAKLSSWALKADYSVGGAFTGQFAQAQVAEAWVEVWGPVGVMPEWIELRTPLGDTAVVQGITTTILP